MVSVSRCSCWCVSVPKEITITPTSNEEVLPNGGTRVQQSSGIRFFHMMYKTENSKSLEAMRTLCGLKADSFSVAYSYGAVDWHRTIAYVEHRHVKNGKTCRFCKEMSTNVSKELLW